MESVGNNNKKQVQRLRPNTNQLVGEFGKVPPQAIDIEQAVLGALMLEKNAINEVVDILTPDSFYDPKHYYIFQAIHTLFGSTSPIDIITVSNQLKSEGLLELAGGYVYISQLTNNIASSAHIEYYARIISQKQIQREMIRMCSEVLKDAYDDTTDVFELLNKAESDLFNIAENNMKKKVDSMQNVVKEAIKEIEVASKNSDGISGIPTGFKDLDKLTSGWQRSDMIVIAARPAMGKTAFVLSMARNTAVDYGMGVAIFSLEMSSVQLVKRLISSESMIKAEKLRKGDLADHEFQQLHSRITKLAKAPIYIDDTAGLNVFDLRAKCRRLKMMHNIELIIIDYLQLMHGTSSGKGGGTREQEISQISRSIKEIAKELNVPIIALSQLSRSVETRGGDKRPLLSDLRESGAIEQDADIVSFIYRPEYYGFTEQEGQSNIGVGEIIIAKHRNGALDTVRLKFTGEYARFDNFDNHYEPSGQVILQSGLNNAQPKTEDMSNFNDEFNLSNNVSDVDPF